MPRNVIDVMLSEAKHLTFSGCYKDEILRLRLRMTAQSQIEEVRVNDAEIWAPDELDTAFWKNPVSNLNRPTLYDLRPQTAPVDQPTHGPFNG
jgi:hypothetical protein